MQVSSILGLRFIPIDSEWMRNLFPTHGLICSEWVRAITSDYDSFFFNPN